MLALGGNSTQLDLRLMLALMSPFIMSLLSATLYLVVAGAAVAATICPVHREDTRGRRLRWAWALMAALFILLAAMRLAGAEAAMQDVLRRALAEQVGYNGRARVQRPLAAALVLVAVLSAAWLKLSRFFRARHFTERYAHRAILGAGAMIALVLLRLISLHTTDRILYGGPHLNRVIDPALTAFVGANAALFARYRFGRRPVEMPVRK